MAGTDLVHDAQKRMIWTSPRAPRAGASQIRLCFAQNFAGQGGNLTLSKENELGQVQQWIAFGPAEVDVWHYLVLISNRHGDGHNRGRNRGGCRFKNPLTVSGDTVNFNILGEVRVVADLDF